MATGDTSTHDRSDGGEAARPGTPAPAWRPIHRSRAHEQVMDAVEDQITAGTLRVGDMLPPERELAAQLQVSRAGVREAIRVLEGLGVVRSQVGSGREAGTFIAAMPSAALTRMLRLHVALANFPVDDVVEARVMLERSSASLAATRADDEQLAGIREPLTQMDERGIDRDDFNELDTLFHVRIADAGGNRLVAEMTTAIRDAMRLPILDSLRRLPDWTELADQLRAQHHGIHDAIVAGDADRAADLADEHIRYAFGALPGLGA
jgi:GntR family transcriptional repressor for pyruvate dehydrogenase complex